MERDAEAATIGKANAEYCKIIVEQGYADPTQRSLGEEIEFLSDSDEIGCPKTRHEFAEFVARHKVDFLDFGCSSGGSIKYGVEVLKGIQGLGLDVSEAKIEQARKAGYLACNFDIAKIPPRKMVDFTLMLHFLEHVSGLAQAREYILKACQVSRKFVLIRQPCFEADAYLLRNGLKLYCADWHGHPNMMSSLGFFQVLRDLRQRELLKDFQLFSRGRIKTSDDPRILPLEAPRDSPPYDPAIHPPKIAGLVFSEPVHFEIAALIAIEPFATADLVSALRVDALLYDSAQCPPAA